MKKSTPSKVVIVPRPTNPSTSQVTAQTDTVTTSQPSAPENSTPVDGEEATVMDEAKRDDA